jgi:hypothetical protein
MSVIVDVALSDPEGNPGSSLTYKEGAGFNFHNSGGLVVLNVHGDPLAAFGAGVWLMAEVK